MIESVSQSSLTFPQEGILYLYDFPKEGTADVVAKVFVNTVVTLAKGQNDQTELLSDKGEPSPGAEVLRADAVVKKGQIAYFGATTEYSEEHETGEFEGLFLLAERKLTQTDENDFKKLCRQWLVNQPL